MSLFLRWCWPTCAFRRTQVTRLQAARVDHQLLEHDARVDHPELQYMFARLIELVLAGRDIGVVGDPLLPDLQVLAGVDVYDLRRLAVERDGGPQPLIVVKIQRG